MEVVLNLAWALSAALLVFLVLRSATQSAGRFTQPVALALLIVILFPVISVTDDLQSIQNPAEPDCCLRRDLVVLDPHPIIPAIAALPQPAFAELSFSCLRLGAPGTLPAPSIDDPALAPIQNRPPPVA